MIIIIICFNKVTPPFQPEITSDDDVGNFDEEFTSEDIEQTFIGDKQQRLIKENEQKFEGFNR
jgi:hypothetical protein